MENARELPVLVGIPVSLNPKQRIHWAPHKDCAYISEPVKLEITVERNQEFRTDSNELRTENYP